MQLSDPTVTMPQGWVVAGLGPTQPLQAYQWRVQARAGTSCSAYSPWARWAEVFPWPF